MNIIFDLDGTLVCSKKRVYELFCDIVESREICFSDYWRLKFIGKNNQVILREKFDYSEDNVIFFVDRWMNEIETDFYLEMDTLINGVLPFLEQVSQEHLIYVCTARQSTSQVTKQLARLSILHLFEDIFVTEQKFTKAMLLKKSGLKFSKADWMIGDTGHDIVTGKEIGINTCAVLSGCMSEMKLREYNPNVILKNVTALII